MCWHRALTALLFGFAPLVAAAQSGISCGTQMSPAVLAFGTYSPLAPGGIAMLLGEIVVSCTNSRNNPTENIKVRAAISAGASGNVAQRQMVSPASPVPLLYNLFQDASYTTLWTDTLGGSGVDLNVPRGGSAQLKFPVFGRVAANQSGVRPGAYIDSLVLSVRY